MSRYRLLPSPAQEAVLRDHCAHARFVWNLAVEQHSHWHPGRPSGPGYLEQCRQLTAARADHSWLAAGSQVVQQQALRDFARAMAAFFDPENPAGRPSWRKAGRNEGFRVVGRRGRHWDVRRLSRHVGEVRVPKAGWVRFRWSRAVPLSVKSYRVTMDRAGRWHVAFAAIPEPVTAPGNGQVVGIDRGVAVSAALSTGELVRVSGLTARECKRLLRLQHKLARAKRGSGRRARVKLAIARLKARETDRRKDWAEKTSTDLARRFDVIRVENLDINGITRSARGIAAKPGRNVRQKAGLNREIMRSGWGLLVRRLQDKAPTDALFLRGASRGLVPQRQVIGDVAGHRAAAGPGHQLLLGELIQVAADGGLGHASVRAASATVSCPSPGSRSSSTFQRWYLDTRRTSPATRRPSAQLCAVYARTLPARYCAKVLGMGQQAGQQPPGGPGMPGPTAGSSTIPVTTGRRTVPKCTTYHTPRQEISDAIPKDRSSLCSR